MVCITALVAFELWRSYLAIREDAERSIQNLTHVLSEQTARTIQSVDLSLQSIVDELEGSPALPDNDPGFRAELHQRLGSLPYVRALYVIGPDGFISHDTDYPKTPRVSLADRGYFSIHRDDPSVGLYIAHPLLSRSLGIWFAALSRRIETPEGGFGGVVVAAVEPLYFEQFYRQLWVGGGTIALFLDDGTLLARSPRNEDAMTRSFGAEEPFRSLLKRNRLGYNWSSSPIDGIERLAGYQALEDIPIVVLVTLNKAEVMRPWNSHATVLVIGAVILLALLAVMEWLSRRHRLQEELARKQVEEAQRLETVGRFSSVIAHDLGNLERIVRSAALLLRRMTSGRADAVKLLDEIDMALGSGRDMIDQLLAYARSSELRPEMVDLNALIANSMPVLRRAAGSEIEITTCLEGSETICLIDAFQFQASLVNLVMNSRDAMPLGGVIMIDLRIVEGNQRWAQVSVSDEGSGMSSDVLKQAFDPFFTTKTPEHGNGLGLSQVLDFIRRSDGQVELSSVEGRGATVYLRFPLAANLQPGEIEGRSPDSSGE